jgi:hypothetical protein
VKFNPLLILYEIFLTCNWEKIERLAHLIRHFIAQRFIEVGHRPAYEIEAAGGILTLPEVFRAAGTITDGMQ